MNPLAQAVVKDSDLTEAQKIAIAEDFNFREKAELTEDEIDQLVTIFDTPEKLLILRKLFLVVSEDERGISIVTPSIGDVGADWEKFGLLTYANSLANEQVKNSLLMAYKYIANRRKEKMKTKFVAENIKLDKQTEKDIRRDEIEEIASREVGENL